jgi:hypothetical protein
MPSPQSGIKVEALLSRPYVDIEACIGFGICERNVRSVACTPFEYWQKVKRKFAKAFASEKLNANTKLKLI